MNTYERIKQNNKGLSLVELIVAIAIGVIVSGSIAALMVFAIRTYRNESVNTSMQYELQSNLNMMMDEIMGASVFVVKQNGGMSPVVPPADAPGKPCTEFAMFGKLYTPSGGTKKFKGVVFVSETVASPGKFKVYMNRIDEECPGSYTDIEKFAAGKASDTQNDMYLLGENLTQFEIVPNTSCFIDTPDPSDPDEPTKTKHEYNNPISFSVNITFERNGWGSKVIKKHVSDTTYLRNKVVDTVYVDGISYDFKKKE